MLAPTVTIQPSSRPSSTMGEREVMASADGSEEKHEPNVKEIVAPARLNVPQPDNKSESDDEDYQEVRRCNISRPIFMLKKFNFYCKIFIKYYIELFKITCY